MSVVHFISHEVPVGTPVPAPHLFESAWDEFIELGVVDKIAWVGNALAMHMTVPRYDIGVFVQDKVVGGLCLAADDDPHVGTCLTVISNYVLPEYRGLVGARCFRECLRVAKRSGYPVLAYTHRLKDWEYKTIYRKLK